MDPYRFPALKVVGGRTYRHTGNPMGVPAPAPRVPLPVPRPVVVGTRPPVQSILRPVVGMRVRRRPHPVIGARPDDDCGCPWI